VAVQRLVGANHGLAWLPRPFKLLASRVTAQGRTDSVHAFVRSRADAISRHLGNDLRGDSTR
jgi:hypothetical protein